MQLTGRHEVYCIVCNQVVSGEDGSHRVFKTGYYMAKYPLSVCAASIGGGEVRQARGIAEGADAADAADAAGQPGDGNPDAVLTKPEVPRLHAATGLSRGEEEANGTAV
ncbi:hypothetical protein [Paenibacillus sp. y28]|uniref:hypothetical protein n=1 Tax=Paenibacillus sp. y28 TaxID=3129110 RepID=UPI00301601C1